uniref:Uncharacterized protein n=1 Tax=viral metagenome TaxID=1070528 RepID=A0A6C0KWM6_9ZZZZ
MINLCPPALIYLVFSLTHIIIDTFKGLYNTAFFKFIVMVMVTFLLNILCEGGLSVVSWIIVFIPFIFMTIIVTMLLYIFGLDAASGTINYKCKDSTTSSSQNTYVVVPKSSQTYNVTTATTTTTTENPYTKPPPPTNSSSSQYESFSLI